MNLRSMVLAALLSALCLVSVNSFAQDKDDKPYNLKKAYEVLQNEHDEDKAIKLLEEQLKSTPKEIESMLLMCRIYRNRGEYGRALSFVNDAIKYNNPKKSGLYNSTLYWWKAAVYKNLEQANLHVEWLEKASAAARKDKIGNLPDILFDLGQAYYDAKRYDEADAVYSEMIRIDESDQVAMTGLARNMIAREKYPEAVAILDKCQKYGEDYSGTYRFRSQAYDKLGETDKAIDDALLWFENDHDALTDELVNLLLKHRTYAVAKSKTMMRTSDSKDAWRVVLIKIYEAVGEYENAIKEYDILEDNHGKSEFVYSRRADCYDNLGLTNIALSEIDKAIELEPDYTNIAAKGQILRKAGRYEEAIAMFDEIIELDPTYAYGYYAKGWSYELSGDDEKAFECYSEGIDLDGHYAYIFLMRGTLYSKRGEKEKADADFETVLQLDTLVGDGSCRQYALHFLGKDDEAMEWMQKLIDADPNDPTNYYDKACLYSRMGKYDESVAALGKALEMGYCSFAHIEHDDDMDGIRDRDDFKALIEQYKAKLAARIEKMGIDVTAAKEEKIIEVPISRKVGGTFNVDCVVNGLTLNMIFDTGASDVTISKVEADFMFKNNYLSTDDVKGKKYYQIADGGISEGTVITLKEVKIGEAVLHNVDASVVKNQKAPLLLGESVLQKFGTFTIDNINSKLIIKQ